MRCSTTPKTKPVCPRFLKKHRRKLSLTLFPEAWGWKPTLRRRTTSHYTRAIRKPLPNRSLGSRRLPPGFSMSCCQSSDSRRRMKSRQKEPLRTSRPNPRKNLEDQISRKNSRHLRCRTSRTPFQWTAEDRSVPPLRNWLTFVSANRLKKVHDGRNQFPRRPGSNSSCQYHDPTGRVTAHRSRRRSVPWRQHPNRVSLGRAKADSPSPRNGSEHPISEIGSRNIPRVFQTGDGEWLDRVSMMVCCISEVEPNSGGCGTGNGTAAAGGNLPSPKTGRKLRRNSGNGFKPGTVTYYKSSERVKT